MANFLGKSPKKEVVERIVRSTSFQQMKNDPDLVENKEHTNILTNLRALTLRKEVVGDWKNYFSAEQAAYVDELAQNMWEPVGLKF